MTPLAQPDDNPAPRPEWTPDGVLVQALILALVQTLGPRKSRALLINLSRELAEASEPSNVEPIRGDRERRAQRIVCARQATRAFRDALPGYLVRLQSGE